MTSQSPDSLAVEMEEPLKQWANANRLSEALARKIREDVQEEGAWEQRFWMRMNTVLLPAPAVVEHVSEQQFGLDLPDLAWMVSQSSFDAPGFCPHLCLSS